ncbi:Tissue alpha-L-fucosidase [Desmophyllum pertusum]|uniref:alpha-L-fucosidase n=1 Tax=Desmophyllum pertusum TaxID=174260 RepID=A0A9X0D474_9CNID|nr:Tissue alpha-L-fucosidase [Desmophyllum pertusum]
MDLTEISSVILHHPSGSVLTSHLACTILCMSGLTLSILRTKRTNLQRRIMLIVLCCPQLYDIINSYKPEYVWSDGDWEASDTYWRSKEFLAWLYNDSPVRDTVVVNDRWGVGDMCHHGGVYTCADRYNPGVLQNHKWEDAMTIDKQSWGYRRNTTMADFLTMDNLTSILASTVSCGGNMLMNVGPTADGRIDPIFQERLEQMGDWLRVNGEGIYGTKPWRAQNDTKTPQIWYTSKPGLTYAIVLEWPKADTLSLGVPVPTEETTVTLLGLPGVKFSWKQLSVDKGIIITIPPLSVSDLPCQWAWVFRMSNVK